EIVNSGIPGVMLSIHDAYGYSSYASGYADLASKVELKPCNITRVGSTVKTFTAVSILLLQEDGELNIDDPITNYLSNQQIQGLENASNCTIRQLLQHSSGIYNYIQDIQFQTASLNNLLKTWEPNELLDYARGKDAYFAQGTDVKYSNTNYILLGMIIDSVTNEPFYEFFRERIFEPLGLEFTQFAALNNIPEGIIRSYIDLYSNLNLINSTYYSGWDYHTADGGLISNVYDMNAFFTALVGGEIISQSSLNEMMEWIEPNEIDTGFFPISYGLGIFKMETQWGDAYFHSGDAIGYYANMVHFPDQNVTITWATNGNYGKLDDISQSKEAMETIFETIFE
ncbi:MAG: beta-lactamase family protein, partial [Ignavibacteriae bacterium]|nr:beta-lactamase family protein [Ignavibacteriota bacterium]